MHLVFPLLPSCRYLVDRANLLLFMEGPGGTQQLLSLQEAQDLMVGAGVGMDLYQVFCKLTRAGYIAQRHPARWIAGPREDLPAIWAHWREAGGAGACLAGETSGAGPSVPARDGGAPAPGTCTGWGASAEGGSARPAGSLARSRAWWALGSWARAESQDNFWAAQPRVEVLQGSKAQRRAAYPCLQPLAQTSGGELAQVAFESGAATPKLVGPNGVCESGIHRLELRWPGGGFLDFGCQPGLWCT